MFELVNRILAWHNSRDRGASAVEYALILAAIAAAIALLVSQIGGIVVGKFATACAQLNGGKAC